MKDPKLKNIPVIMMSVNEENEIITASLAKGAKDYIIKPLRTTVHIFVLIFLEYKKLSWIFERRKS